MVVVRRGGSQRVEHHQQGEPHRVTRQGRVLGVHLVRPADERIGHVHAQRLFAPRAARPQLVEAHPGPPQSSATWPGCPPHRRRSCAGGLQGDEVLARNLTPAATRAGTTHLVNISVVGADRIPVVSGVDRAMFGYFSSKLLAEQVVGDSGLPLTTLRATQFHDLVLTAAQQLSKLPVVPAMSGCRFQPIDADEVAVRLVELALAAPAGVVPANLAPGRAVGRRTWEGFLAEKGPSGDPADVVEP
jgi:hypothetical protein